MSVERHPGSLRGLPDDQLGTIAVSLVVGELTWTPDVTPAVMDRISRDAVAYPERFDRRPTAPPPPMPPQGGPSAKRAVGRLAVFGIILVIIVGLVLFTAAVSATQPVASLPIGEIDGTLDVRRILHVITETS